MQIVLLKEDHAECNQRPLKGPLTLYQQNDQCRVFVSILLLSELEHAMNYKMIYRQIGKHNFQ